MYRLVLLFVALATAENVVKNGNCPDLKPVANFNVSAYQGIWYEVSKYPSDAEKKGNCASAEYKLDGDQLKLRNTHVVDAVQTSIEGTARLAPDAHGTGKLMVSLKFGDKMKESPLYVLSTDYTGYAVVYNCKYDEKNKNHQDFAWILSRTKKLEGPAKTAADDFIKATSELDATKFLSTDFSDEACKFTKTSTITE